MWFCLFVVVFSVGIGLFVRVVRCECCLLLRVVVYVLLGVVFGLLLGCA